MKISISRILNEKAKKVMPGGVNSPVRAFGAVGGTPVFITRGSGSKIYDEDGKEYIDFVASWGPLILGHSDDEVIRALKKSLEKGTTFGAPTKNEIEIAEKITEIFPSIEMVRLVNSGTESTMSAIRLARAFSKKEKIIKFEGCYHGHVDSLLVKAGSGSMTMGIPTSKGIQKSSTEDTIVLPFNNIEIFEETIDKFHENIAAVILEPVPANMGVIIPKENFLTKIRNLTEKHKTLLIFDEVITGFRLTPGGAQEMFGIRPDLTCLGKIIGGGLPVGAYGGRKEIMEYISPLGPVYQAGTLSGNPMAVTAGLTTINKLVKLSQKGFYDELEKKTRNFALEIKKRAEFEQVSVTVNQIGSMLTVFFTDKNVYDYETAKTSSEKKYAVYFWKMLEEGIYLAPSQYEATFISYAHSDEDLEKALKASKMAFREVRKVYG